jgi:hypothetical protein
MHCMHTPCTCLAQLEEQHGDGHRADEHAEGAALLRVRAHAAEPFGQQPEPRLGRYEQRDSQQHKSQ